VTALERFEMMVAARRFDEVLLAHREALRGHYHVSIGLESTAAALAELRQDEDGVMTNYRNHAHLLAVGADPEDLYAEILGRESPQRGRSGTLHLADPANGVPYTSAMVAGGLPLAIGMAFARVRTGRPGIVVCFFGDGAFGEGAVHESLNIAALWRLPVLFVCENNGEPDGGRANAYQSAASLTAIAEVHQVGASAADARHPQALCAAAVDAASAVRRDRAPFLLEARAAAWPGNAPFFPEDLTGPTSIADAATRRGEAWYDADDPVLNEARALLADGVALERLAEAADAAHERMERAFAAARGRAPADPRSVLTDVLAGP